MDTTFLSGANAVFLSELYDQYLNNPASVDPSWAAFFRDLGDDRAELIADLHGASWGNTPSGVIGVPDPDAAAPANGKDKGSRPAAAPSGAVDQAAVMKQAED